MAVDRFERDGLVVLAGDRQHDPAPCERLQPALEIDECLAARIVTAEPEILPALLADRPTPYGVIEVHDDELACAPRERRKACLYVARRFGQRLRGERKLAHVPGPWCVGRG